MYAAPGVHPGQWTDGENAPRELTLAGALAHHTNLKERRMSTTNVARRAPSEPETEVSLRFTLCDYEVPANEASAAARGAARLHLLAVKGLIRDAQDFMIEPEDLRLLHDLAEFTVLKDDVADTKLEREDELLRLGVT